MQHSVVFESVFRGTRRPVYGAIDEAGAETWEGTGFLLRVRSCWPTTAGLRVLFFAASGLLGGGLGLCWRGMTRTEAIMSKNSHRGRSRGSRIWTDLGPSWYAHTKTFGDAGRTDWPASAHSVSCPQVAAELRKSVRRRRTCAATSELNSASTAQGGNH